MLSVIILSVVVPIVVAPLSVAAFETKMYSLLCNERTQTSLKALKQMYSGGLLGREAINPIFSCLCVTYLSLSISGCICFSLSLSLSLNINQSIKHLLCYLQEWMERQTDEQTDRLINRQSD